MICGSQKKYVVLVVCSLNDTELSQVEFNTVVTGDN